MTKKKQDEKKPAAQASEQEKTATETPSQPTAEERIAELEEQLAKSDKARKELEQVNAELTEQLAESDKVRKKLEEKLKQAEDELEQLKDSQADSPVPPPPPPPPPKPRTGDCRGCAHFPENVAEDGRAAESWLTRTKAFAEQPCGSGLCANKKFERK